MVVHLNKKVVMVVGKVIAFDPPYIYARTFQMANIDEPLCQVTYSSEEKNGGTEINLTIENAIETAPHRGLFAPIKRAVF